MKLDDSEVESNSNTKPNEMEKQVEKQIEKKQLEKKERKKNLIKIGWLRIDISQAKNLASFDSNGTSDPYCKINILTNEADKANKDNIKRIRVDKTSVIKKALNPLWDENFFSVVDEHFESLEIEMFDQDMIGSHDFMGRVIIKPNLEENSFTVDDWFDLAASPNHKSKKPPTGKLKLGVFYKEAKEFHSCLLFSFFLSIFL